MPVAFTTDLPDTDAPALGNGVEDEIAVTREAQTTNYGHVRIQAREVGATTWGASAAGFTEITVAHDTLSTSVTGREDGEAYEVRLRTETEHRTGAWTTPVQITTKFPGAVSPAASSTDRTTVDVTWTDRSDNEDGFQVERRTVRDDDTRSAWRMLVDLPPDTAAYTDDDARPGTTLEYRVRAYTEDAAAVSGVASETTPKPRLSSTPRASSGWTVEIDHPSGQTLRPSLLGSPTWSPTINGVPTLTIHSRGTDRWLDADLEGAPVRAWFEGRRVPVSSLQSVTATPDGAELSARGSTELDRPVRLSIVQQEAHAAARELIDQTGLARNVDDPATDRRTDVVLQSLADGDALVDALAGEIAATDPLELQSNGIRTLQTCWTREAGTYDQGDVGTQPGDQYSDGAAVPFISNRENYAEWSFTPAYDVPAGALRVAYRNGSTSDPPTLEWSVNGTTVETTNNPTQLGWSVVDASEIGTLPAGETVTVRVEETKPYSGTRFVDVVAPFDDRYSYTFDNTLDSDNALSGPEHYPSAVTLAFAGVDAVDAVVGGRAELQLSSTAGQQAIRLSNDQGATFSGAENTASFETDFGESGTSLTLEVDLSRTGSQSATPTAGVDGQTLSAVDLLADLDAVPLLDNETVEIPLGEALTVIADQSNMIWELTHEPGQGPTVQMTTPGQRQTAADPSLIDWSVTRDADGIVRRCVVKGRTTSHEETFVADHSTAAALSADWLQPGQETVLDPDTGETYVRGQDYRVDWQAGEVTVLAGGDIPDGATLRVRYQAHVRATFESPDFDDPSREKIVEVPGAATPTAAEQIAKRIVRTSATPRTVASADIPDGPRPFDLVDALDVDGVPVDAQEVESISASPEGVRLQLANRRPVDAVISELQSRLDETARSV